MHNKRKYNCVFFLNKRKLKSIAEWLCHKDDLISVLMSLICRHQVAAAHSAAAVTAFCGLFSVCTAYALPCFTAGSIQLKPCTVSGSSHFLNSQNRLIQVVDYLVAAHNKYHRLGSVGDGSDSVGISVNVIKLAVESHGICRGKVCIGEERCILTCQGSYIFRFSSDPALRFRKG